MGHYTRFWNFLLVDFNIFFRLRVGDEKKSKNKTLKNDQFFNIVRKKQLSVKLVKVYQQSLLNL